MTGTTEGKGPDRGRGAVLGIAAVVIVALLAVVAAVVLVGGDDEEGDEAAADTRRGEDEEAVEPPDEWDERVAPIAEWVEEERELTFEHPVEVRFLPEDDYTEAIRAESTGADAEDLEDTVALMRAVGLVSGDVDLESANADLAGATTAAYYSPIEKAVYVRGEEMTPAVRTVVAHELTHVLQDQHFDLDRLVPAGDDDEPDPDAVALAAGLRAVGEGDANRIQAAYAEAELTGAEVDELRDEAEEDQAAGEEAAAEVPPALAILSTAPYALGEGFVLALEGDTEAIDAALEDPPSEEVLLDPAARDTDRPEEVEVEAPTAPEGAEVVDEDVFGPLSWFLVLAARSEPAAALAVVDGWGGDAMVSYRQDDRLCVDVVVAGDDAEATAAFRTALDAWAGQHPGDASVEEAGDAVLLRSCDPGEGAEAVGELPVEVLAVPVGRTRLEVDFMEAEGATPEQARCLSTGVLEEVSIDDLLAEEISPELAERVRTIAQGCQA